MKVHAWIDSGANIHSKRDVYIDVDEDEWSQMDEKEKEELVRDSVFEYLDWGWHEPNITNSK